MTMYQDATVGVVIPAYNEAGLIGDVLESIPSFVDRAYVVDDRSTDGTWDEIQRRVEGLNGQGRPTIADGSGHFEPWIVPVRHDRNRGRGAAVKTGYRRALDDGLDVIAVLDGDGQMDPGILDRFVAPIVAGTVDYTKGNRLTRRDYRRGMSTWRFVGNWLLTYLTKVASGYWRMTDSQNGYTAVSAHALRQLDLDRLYNDYGFLNDVLVKLNAAELRVGDVVMPARYGNERSGIRYVTFVPKVSWLLTRDFWWRLKVKYLVTDFHPLVQLYALGGVGGLFGVGLLAWLLATATTSATGAAIVALLLLIAGVSTSLAMTFDRAHNAHLERHLDATPDAPPIEPETVRTAAERSISE